MKKEEMYRPVQVCHVKYKIGKGSAWLDSPAFAGKDLFKFSDCCGQDSGRYAVQKGERYPVKGGYKNIFVDLKMSETNTFSNWVSCNYGANNDLSFNLLCHLILMYAL